MQRVPMRVLTAFLVACVLVPALAGVGMRFRVVDEKGTPVAGATVQVLARRT